MKSRFGRQYWPKTKLFIIIVFSVSFFLFISRLFLSLEKFSQQTGFNTRLLNSILFNRNNYLKQSDSVTNILLLGISGGSFSGNDLTDTMMIVSINNRKISQLSLPRDIWSDELKDKINSAYHYGEEKKIGGGLILSKITAEDILGIPVHYVAIIDFSTFKQIIDAIGGLEINVSAGFVDNLYPIEGKENDTCNGDKTLSCRYESIKFDKGNQLMNGDKALKYVRSRHAVGTQGSDFDRGRRQQEVITALKNRLYNFRQIFNFTENISLFKLLSHSIKSDMTPGEMVAIGYLTVHADKQNNVSIEKYLEVGNPDDYDGRYVLITKDTPSVFQGTVRQLLDIKQ